MPNSTCDIPNGNPPPDWETAVYSKQTLFATHDAGVASDALPAVGNGFFATQVRAGIV